MRRLLSFVCGLLVVLALVEPLGAEAALPGLPTSESDTGDEIATTEPDRSGSASSWQKLTFWIQQQQNQLHRQLSEHLQALSQGKAETTAWGLLLLSFLYGIFHAAGPGHGKAVLTAYLTSQPERLGRGLWLSFIAAQLQAVTAILLVWVLVHIFGWLARQAYASVPYLEKASYLLIALLGLGLLLSAAKRLLQDYRARQTPDLQSSQWQPLQPGVASNYLNPLNSSEVLSQQTVCSHCGRAHHLNPDDLDDKKGLKTAGLLLSIGLRPCSGGVLVLVVANLLGLWWTGVLAVFAMALGTSITVMTLALLAVKARQLALRLLGEKHFAWRWFTGALGGLGGLLIFLLGLSLLLATGSEHPLGVV
ncbi:nickel/cobalt transporter [Marinospirillum perlucidum]|uniref:nickel/cobalt transporter n=1 Tax=Marinospirillum perlucidum TaxID=1982602 RepID=UPI000DF3DDE1|nr:hypothetical protein [Marinospirillum perlucidum]